MIDIGKDIAEMTPVKNSTVWNVPLPLGKDIAEMTPVKNSIPTYSRF